MSRYHRRGHWRTSKNGTRHWVSGHTVDRGPGWSWTWGLTPTSTSPPPRVPAPRPAPPTYPTPVRWRRALPEEPNATCPSCGAKVWFFRNEFGGCAYFDALGRPWPLHPCFEPNPSHQDRAARRQAIEDYDAAQKRAARKALREQRRAIRNGRREVSRPASPMPKPEDAGAQERAQRRAARARSAADNAPVREARRALKRDRAQTVTAPRQQRSRIERQASRAEQSRKLSAADRKRLREDPLGALRAPMAPLAPTHVERQESVSVPGCGAFVAMVLVIAAIILLASVVGR